MIGSLCELIRNKQISAIGLDFETTGVSPYSGDYAFISGIAYRHPEAGIVSFSTRNISDIIPILELSGIYICAHNATFELAFIENQLGFDTSSLRIWDTMVFERHIYNNHLKYSLQACAERRDLTKYPPMLEWLKKNGKKDYTKAPPYIIIPYVMMDAELSLRLYEDQREILLKDHKSSPYDISTLINLEQRTTHNIFSMERNGLLVDVEYCKKALSFERASAETKEKELTKFLGSKFIDSRKFLAPHFDRLGISYTTTDKGNPSFDSECLKASDHPLCALILEYRTHLKRASTYWENFINLERGGVIHPTINQGGTASGRFSAKDPNVQNWPGDDDDKLDLSFPIRRAFIARPGCKIVSGDYSQMELRYEADQAEDFELIKAISDGRDLHTELSLAAKVTRFVAKRGRFAWLYGAGAKRLSEILHIPLADAERLVSSLRKESPKIVAFTRRLIKNAESIGFGRNLYGRKYFFDGMCGAYKYPNYFTQGGCADVLRIAIDNCQKVIREHAKNKLTFMLIPIHDEIVFNIHESDMHIVPLLRKAMIDAYTVKKMLAMDVNFYVGDNFYDLEKIRV